MQKIDELLFKLQSEYEEAGMLQAERIKEENPNDLAYILSHIKASLFQPLMRLVIESVPESLSEIVAELSHGAQEEFFEMAKESDQRQMVKGVLEEIEPDDRAHIISSLKSELADWLTKVMSVEDLTELKDLFQYPSESCGRIMTPDFFSVLDTATILDTFNALKTRSGDAETINYIYVLDYYGRLKGVASIRELLFRQNDLKMSAVMNDDISSANVLDDQETAARLVEHYNLAALPVVDNEGRLKGIITVDDVIDIIRREGTEDIMKLAGSTSFAINMESPFRSFRQRVPWLFVSFIGGLLTVKVMSELSSSIQNIIFVAFVPVIVGMGGNVASQSSAIIVRGLAIGQIHINKLWSILSHEILTALMLGLFFGGLLFFTSQWEFGEIAHLGGSVALGIIFSMLLATTFASILPILFHKMSIDPAVATGPFVTVSIDILGILTYIFSIKLVTTLFG